MPIYRVIDKDTIAELFAGWEETFIWSCLQNCMGEAYVTSLVRPRAAQIILGDICFLAGEVSGALVRNRLGYSQHDFVIMVPQNERWAAEIEAAFQDKAHRHMRYAIKKEADVFDKARLHGLAAQLPDRYALRLIDREVYAQAMAVSWAQDLCGNFTDYDDYRKNGLGVAVLKDGTLVSGASSYAYFHGGIEVEIDTRSDERRKGLATACGARLILECLERGLYPSWDAHNKESLALAEKLGYHFDKEYLSYEVHGI